MLGGDAKSTRELCCWWNSLPRVPCADTGQSSPGWEYGTSWKCSFQATEVQDVQAVPLALEGLCPGNLMFAESFSWRLSRQGRGRFLYSHNPSNRRATRTQPRSTTTTRDKQELEHTVSFFKLLSLMDLSDSSQGLTCSLPSSGCHRADTEQTHSQGIRNICSNTGPAFIFPEL